MRGIDRASSLPETLVARGVRYTEQSLDPCIDDRISVVFFEAVMVEESGDCRAIVRLELSARARARKSRPQAPTSCQSAPRLAIARRYTPSRTSTSAKSSARAGTSLSRSSRTGTGPRSFDGPLQKLQYGVAHGRPVAVDEQASIRSRVTSDMNFDHALERERVQERIRIEAEVLRVDIYVVDVQEQPGAALVEYSGDELGFRHLRSPGQRIRGNVFDGHRDAERVLGLAQRGRRLDRRSR